MEMYADTNMPRFVDNRFEIKMLGENATWIPTAISS